MPIKRIKTFQQSNSAASVVLLEGGTYDTDLCIVDPEDQGWGNRLETDSRTWSHTLTFEDGTTLSVDPQTIMLERSKIRIVARPDRP